MDELTGGDRSIDVFFIERIEISTTTTTTTTTTTIAPDEADSGADEPPEG